MSDERHITRRASLRGIAATGALIGGTGLSAGTASAEKKDAVIKKIKFKDCHSLAIHLKDGVNKVPITIRTYNAEYERVENIQLKIKRSDLVPYKLWKGIYEDKKKEKMEYDPESNEEYDGKKKAKCLCKDHDNGKKHKKKKYVWLFSIYQFYNHAIDAGDKIISVKIGDERIKNTNECAKKYPHEYDKKGEVDTNEIYLKPICVNSKHNTVRYRVDNWNKKPVTVSYDAYNTKYGGEVYVEPHSATYFDVKAYGSDGYAKVGLYHNDTQIDTVEPNGLRECLAKDQVGLEISDVDYAKHYVKFYLHDGTDFDRTFNYYDHKSGAAGTVTVHDEPGSAETFWLPAPYCKASVKLFYQGHVVGKAKTGSNLSGPVVNKTKKESYDTIQEAVDMANEGDTIIVCEDQQSEETVIVDVEGLEIKGFKKPVVEVNDRFAIRVDADDVTIDGLKIRNPEGGTSVLPGEFSGAVGITVSPGSENVCIQNNVITDIGTENDNANPIGVLSNDGTSRIKIYNNKIRNLEGTDEDEGAAQAILIIESGTQITDAKVKNNTITGLLDTRSTVAVRFNGDVTGKISGNDISDLNTEGQTNAGDPGGFTQVISLAQGANGTTGPSNVTIENNSISDIETTTPDNFFAPTHVILGASTDATTVTIESNHFSGDSTDDDEFYVIDETGDLDLNSVLNNNSFSPSGDVISFNGGAIVKDE